MSKKPVPLPKSLAACADLLYTTRQKRLEVQATVDELASLESALKERLINGLEKGEASGIAGKVAKVFVDTKDVPTISDWDKFLQKWGFKHPEALQRRINASVIEEHWAAKEKIPGIDKFKAVFVSCTKR